ncbi:MAG: hypothetical protein MI861_00665, partial [Pirellulales bacterium]|nr:hypothetical protein [Pirellulales bacterium]
MNPLGPIIRVSSGEEKPAGDRKPFVLPVFHMYLGPMSINSIDATIAPLGCLEQILPSLLGNLSLGRGKIVTEQLRSALE